MNFFSWHLSPFPKPLSHFITIRYVLITLPKDFISPSLGAIKNFDFTS